MPPRSRGAKGGHVSSQTTAPPRRHTDDYAHLEPLFAEAAAGGTTAARRAELERELVLGHRPVAEHIAARFRNRGQPQEDLVQVALLGLVNAVRRFDPGHGANFLAFAVPTITGEIRRHFRDTSWSVRVPRRLQELHAALDQAGERLATRLGRAPRPSELAAELDLPLAEVREGIEAGQAFTSVPLDRPVTADGAATVADQLGATEDGYAEVERRDLLRPALAALPPREARILALRFGENLTQSQIAARVGISQMHVSRLLAGSLRTLRELIAVPAADAVA
jgi:RNA polymerase sigma-B factor